jgi:hypothetical protein
MRKCGAVENSSVVGRVYAVASSVIAALRAGGVMKGGVANNRKRSEATVTVRIQPR